MYIYLVHVVLRVHQGLRRELARCFAIQGRDCTDRSTRCVNNVDRVAIYIRLNNDGVRLTILWSHSQGHDVVKNETRLINSLHWA
jgi:hypothetical protein